MAGKQRECPTPKKIKFDTRASANDELRSGRTLSVRVYRCHDHYHLTSRPNFKT